VNLPEADPLGLYESEDYSLNHLKWLMRAVVMGLIVDGFTFDEFKVQLFKVPGGPYSPWKIGQ
jgi:hypothetical protein